MAKNEESWETCCQFVGPRAPARPPNALRVLDLLTIDRGTSLEAYERGRREHEHWCKDAATEVHSRTRVKGYVMRRLVAFWVFGIFLGIVNATAATASPSGAAAEVGSDIQAIVQPADPAFYGLRDEATMFLVGTLLIGLAGAVRRAA